MRPRYLIRLAAVIGLSVSLAVVTGVHAFSNTKFTDEPEAAIALNPFNGPARANLAFDQFYASVQEWAPSDNSNSETVAAEAMAAISRAAESASEEALRAHQLEPLSPKAHTILALAAPSLEIKNEIIDAASRLNKRQLVLQGLLLEKNIAEGSYPKAIETLDQTLRAHPEVSNRFFPSLVEVLTLDATLPQFVDLFGSPLPWRQQFLNFAVKDDRALKNLAALRAEVVLDDENFDRRLIARLIEQGELDSARSVYQVVQPTPAGKAISERLDWLTDYPPIEWRLASERGLRADVVNNGSALMLEVSPGRGGVVASRLISPDNARFFVRIDHDLKLAERSDQVKLRVKCLLSKKVVFEGQVVASTEKFEVIPNGPGCDALLLEITARVWTDSDILKGYIRSVSVSTQR